MMKRIFLVATVILVLVLSIVSCTPTPATAPTTAPPTSEYPADISGQVIIPHKVIGEPPELRLADGLIRWIIHVRVKNKSYENRVTSDSHGWKIIVKHNEYLAEHHTVAWGSPSTMSVPSGQIGETVLRFVVPSTLRLSGDAKLCYIGQEPYSYGKLTAGDKVAAYDWSSKKVVTEEEKPEEQPTESYVVYKGPYSGSYTKDLKTIEHWTGSDKRIVEFNAGKSPLVINYGYTKTSEIKSMFQIAVQSEKGNIYPVIGSDFWQVIMNNGEILEGTGTYKIKVTSSGCDWWIKIGVEP